MTAQLIDGKSIATRLRSELKHHVDLAKQTGFRVPGLAVILIGADPASEIYVKHKVNACHELGFYSLVQHFPSSITQQELINQINNLNQDNKIDGILIQLPLPAHLDQETIIETINIEKDVDAFHPYHLGRLVRKCPILRSCTPFGIMQLLSSINYNLSGKNVTIVGASNIVGKPMMLEVLMAGATPTLCHRQTKDLKSAIEQADVLITAMGQPGVINSDWIKKDAVVIDVGITRLENGFVVGDIDFETAKERASYITPVPGGVGPMTVTALLQNTLTAYQLRNKKT